MKIRNGFVSNSSSSSFMCDVCFEEISGMDLGLEEAQMYECNNGHIFCECHVEEMDTDMASVKKFCLEETDADEDEKIEILAMDDDELMELAENYDYFDNDREEYPSSNCPICTFKHPRIWDTQKYFLKKLGLTETDLMDELKKQFKNYDEFEEFIKETKDED